jgi:hypothetical protein
MPAVKLFSSVNGLAVKSGALSPAFSDAGIRGNNIARRKIRFMEVVSGAWVGPPRIAALIPGLARRALDIYTISEWYQ